MNKEVSRWSFLFSGGSAGVAVLSSGECPRARGAGVENNAGR